ncbi:hypothetical protein ACEV8T_23465, partial [Vibrio parahaemolyticus]
CRFQPLTGRLPTGGTSQKIRPRAYKVWASGLDLPLNPALLRSSAMMQTGSGVHRLRLLTSWMALITFSFLPVKLTPDDSPSGHFFHRNNS